MTTKRSTEELITAFRAGELETSGHVNTEPIEVAPEVMISRSLRLPIDVMEALQTLAASQGTKWSTLVREWVTEKVVEAQAASGQKVDPVIQLRRALAEANQAAKQLGIAA